MLASDAAKTVRGCSWDAPNCARMLLGCRHSYPKIAITGDETARFFERWLSELLELAIGCSIETPSRCRHFAFSAIMPKRVYNVDFDGVHQQTSRTRPRMQYRILAERFCARMGIIPRRRTKRGTIHLNSRTRLRALCILWRLFAPIRERENRISSIAREATMGRLL